MPNWLFKALRVRCSGASALVYTSFRSTTQKWVPAVTIASTKDVRTPFSLFHLYCVPCTLILSSTTARMIPEGRDGELLWVVILSLSPPSSSPPPLPKVSGICLSNWYSSCLLFIPTISVYLNEILLSPFGKHSFLLIIFFPPLSKKSRTTDVYCNNAFLKFSLWLFLVCTSIEINGRTRTSLDFPAGYFKRVVFYFGYRVCGIASDRTTGTHWGG